MLGGFRSPFKEGACVSEHLCPHYTTGTRPKRASLLQSFSPKQNREVKSRHISLLSILHCWLWRLCIPLNRSVMSISHACGMSVWVIPASKDLEFQNLLLPMQTNNQPENSKCKVTTTTTLYHMLEKQLLGTLAHQIITLQVIIWRVWQCCLLWTRCVFQM